MRRQLCLCTHKDHKCLVHSPLTELSLSPTICLAMKAAMTAPGPREETEDVRHYSDTGTGGSSTSSSRHRCSSSAKGWIDFSSPRLPQANYRYPQWTRVDALSLIKLLLSPRFCVEEKKEESVRQERTEVGERLLH